MSRSATVHDLAPSKLPPPPTLQTILQLGVGGGVKAGCNVWRALRNIEGDRAMHTTWRHLGGKGITGEHPLLLLPTPAHAVTGTGLCIDDGAREV